MRVVLTGATTPLGRRVVQRLLALSPRPELVLLVRPEERDAWRGAAMPGSVPEAEVVVADLVTPERYGPALAGATVCLFDSLHLLQPDEQDSLLERLAGAAESGSLVLIRTAFRNSGLRYYSTLFKEYATRPAFWIRGGVIFFPERGDLLSVFSRRGLQTAVSPLWGGMPFGGHLVVVERPQAPPQNFETPPPGA